MTENPNAKTRNFILMRWESQCQKTGYFISCNKNHNPRKKRHILMVSCQKYPTCHAYAWPIGPFWQDTLDSWIGVVFFLRSEQWAMTVRKPRESPYRLPACQIKAWFIWYTSPDTGLILGLHPANERRRYFVTTSLIGWGKPRNSPVIYFLGINWMWTDISFFVNLASLIFLETQID